MSRIWFLLGLALVAFPFRASAQETPRDYLDAAEQEYKAANLNAAWTDFGIFCNLAPKDDDTDYVRIFIWLTRCQLGHRPEADGQLVETLKTMWNGHDTDWVSKIADFLLERIPESDLLAAADSPGVETPNQQHCEAWYYIGMKHLLAGDKIEAAADFQKCLSTKESDFTEYDFAQAQVKMLGQ